MKLIFKNKVYRFLTISRLLNSMGSSLYNIVFIVYAANMFHSKIIVSLANITMVIPTIFTVFVGIKADNTVNKRRFLILTGFVQAILFTLISLIINEATLLVFSTVSLFNIISDILSDYSNGLRMPIIQKNVGQNDLIEAYSFTQFISYICNLSGQAIGVWLLTTSQNNFTIVALMNALSFFLSVCILIPVKKELTHENVKEEQSSDSFFKQLSSMFSNIKMIFNESSTTNFIHSLIAILLLNTLGGSITAIYNIFLLNQNILNLSYSKALLVVETILVGGILIGSLTPHDYFSKLSIDNLLKITAVVFTFVGLSNLFHFSSIIGIIILSFATYLSGKVNPKINSLLLTNLPSNVLARTSNFLSLLFTLSIPVGTTVFCIISSWNMNITWAIFTIIATTILVLSSQKTK
ncbi:transporter [Streptococcus gallolyticus]|uniref:Transporter n=1 Tax=Streptococcus gallolyticus TaxID=315405 RepID=A0A368UDY3_9STRE|nr:MFS transporter [Streptococcus gallolyticus]RCW17155.1 transporter [Streptococcus gallolyticus]